MKAGYARGVCSSEEVQHLLDAFREAGCVHVLLDTHPGQKREFERLVSSLGPGDVLVTLSADCVAEMLCSRASAMADLKRRGVSIEILGRRTAIAASDRRSHTSQPGTGASP